MSDYSFCATTFITVEFYLLILTEERERNLGMLYSQTLYQWLQRKPRKYSDQASIEHTQVDLIPARFHSSAGRALHRYRGGHMGSNPVEASGHFYRPPFKISSLNGNRNT